MALPIRAARLLALAIAIGWSVTNTWYRITDWSLADMDAYWNAALRVREGALLYPPLADPSAPDVYRYAPWFAWAWVPLTYLPKALVSVAWSAILLAATAAALRPFMRATAISIAAGTLIGSLLIWGASVGNVQPLLIAMLVNGIDRRSGPLWIGVAASLKLVPILYALLYVGRGEWRRALLALLVAALLMSPLVVTPLTFYPLGSEDTPSPLLALSPWLYGAALLGMAAVTLRLASKGSTFSRLSAAGAVLAATPRISILDLTHLAVGAGGRSPDRSPESVRPVH